MSNHALKEMYMLNYGTINYAKNFYYSYTEVLIDFINSLIAVHVFYKQLHFLPYPQVTYGPMNFQSET